MSNDQWRNSCAEPTTMSTPDIGHWELVIGHWSFPRPLVMSWKTTWVLLTVSALLFVFIYFVERKSSSSSETSAPPPRLLTIKTEEIVALKLERTNRVILWAEKTNQNWNLTLPLFYPAQTFAIDSLLQSLAELTSATYI